MRFAPKCCFVLYFLTSKLLYEPVLAVLRRHIFYFINCRDYTTIISTTILSNKLTRNYFKITLKEYLNIIL